MRDPYEHSTSGRDKEVEVVTVPVAEIEQRIAEMREEAASTGRWQRDEIEGVPVVIAPGTLMSEFMLDFWRSYFGRQDISEKGESVGPCTHSPADQPDCTLLPRLMAVWGIYKREDDHLRAELIYAAAARIEYLEAQLAGHQAADATIA